ACHSAPCPLRGPLSPPPLSRPPSPSRIHPLSLHDALPIWGAARATGRPPRYEHAEERRDRRRAPLPASPGRPPRADRGALGAPRSEEHTSELQSRFDLVCRLLLEKKKATAIVPAVRRRRAV